MTVLHLPDVAGLTMGDAALAYARAGIPVFPLAQRTKRPIYMGGFNQATVDLDQVEEWWDDNPDANIGAVPGRVGCIVPDIDTLEAQTAWYNLVPITTAATQTGGGTGMHPWYRSDALHGRSHWRLDEHGGPFHDDRLANLLFRASGGYVVVAPSIHPDTGAAYVLVDSSPISDLPTDIEAKLLSIPSRAAGGGHVANNALAQAWFDEFSKPETSEGGEAVLRRRIANIVDAPKDTRNDTLLAEVGVLLNAAYSWDIDLEAAKEAIRAVYVPHVADTRKATAANREVDHAFAYVATQRYWEGPLEEAIGGLPMRLSKGPMLAAPITQEDREQAVVDELIASASRLPMRAVLTGDVPEIDWLVRNLVPWGRLTSIVAEAKAGKSLLALDLAASLAAGQPFLGHQLPNTVKVLYVDYEMTPSDLADRLQDMRYDRDEATILALEQNLVYYQIPPIDPLDTEAGGKTLTKLVEAEGAEVVIIDTLAAAVEGAENDSDTFRAARHYTWAPLKRMGRTVIRLDHLGKNQARGARGSSMKRDDVDLAWELTASGGHLTLKLAYSRLAGVQDKILLERKTNPLQHVITGSHVWATSSVNLARALTAAGIDTTQPQRKIRETAKLAGITFSSADLKEALYYIEQGMPKLGADMTSKVPSSPAGGAPVPPTPTPPARGTRKKVAGLGTPEVIEVT